MELSMGTAAIALGVGIVGALVYAWRFRSTRTVPWSALWLTVPLLGAAIALLLGPPNLAMFGLAAVALVLAILALVGPFTKSRARSHTVDDGPSG